LTEALRSQSFPIQEKMPFKEAFKEVNRRDSWPPTILRLHEDDLSPEEIDANPFAYFLTSPTPEDDDDYEYFEDLSAGIEATNESTTPVREVSPSSLQRAPLETADDSHAGKAFALPLSLRDFALAHSNSKKEKKAILNTTDFGHPSPPPTPALRGRGTVRLAPNRGRGQTRSRSLSSPRPHSWREPSPDVWSIPEEKEDTSLDNVPPLSLDLAEDSAQASGAEEALIFEEPTELEKKKKPKKRVHWGFLPTRYD
jgi:hypothetical protein